MKHLKKFNTSLEHNSFSDDIMNLVTPNISLIKNNQTVYYTKYETKLIVKYNVIDTSKSIILFSEYVDNVFDLLEIDGVEQPNVINEYTFNRTGEHIVYN